MGSVKIDVFGDFSPQPVPGVEFKLLAGPDKRIPRPPRFIFGSLPSSLSTAYYRLWGISSVGVYVTHGLDLSGEFLLSRDDVYYRCSELNVHPPHIEAELARLGTERRRRRIDGQHVVLAGPGNRVYGHWLIEYLPKLGLLNAAGYDVHALRYLLPSSAPRYVTDWLNLLGIEPHQIVPYDREHETISCDELLVPTIQHNGNRASPLLRQSAAFLRSLIERNHSLQPGGHPQRLFLSRGHFGRSRMLENRAQIEARAAQAGFSMVFPEEMSLIEQIRMFVGAKQLMGEYGSALHGSIFCQAGTVVCALRGTSGHPGFIQSGIGDVLGQPTGYVFGTTAENDPSMRFSIEDDAFESCLRLIFGSFPL